MPISIGDLFAEATSRDLNHDFALPGAERPETLFKAAQRPLILSPSAIAGKAKLDGVEELLITERLGQEFNSAALHRLHRHWNIAMSGDEDYRELRIRPDKLALKIKAALPRQSHVEHQAGGAIRQIGLEKVGNGRKQPRIQIERSQQTPNRGSKVRVIVNDQDGGFCVRHRSCSRSKEQGDEP